MSGQSTALRIVWFNDDCCLNRGMSRDPENYDNPEAFNPSRFFDESGKLNNDEVEYAFGFGRRSVQIPSNSASYSTASNRIWPGRHVASATVWLSIVTVLATFDIRRKKDASGKEIPTDKGYSGGFTMFVFVDSFCSMTHLLWLIFSYPLPFEAAITPRSDTARTLILETTSQRNWRYIYGYFNMDITDALDA